MPDPDAAPEGLAVDAVDWLPSGGRSGLVRVRGRRDPAAPFTLPDLVIEHDGGVERYSSLPDPRAGSDQANWRGAYVVNAAIVAGHGNRMALELPEGQRIALPAPAGDEPPPAVAPVADEGDDSPGGEVVDRAVLAERRARRAEAAEQAQSRIAREALRAVEVLELRANELEEKLRAMRDAAPAEAPAPPAAIPEPPAHAGPDPEVEELRARLAAAEAQAADLAAALEEERSRAAGAPAPEPAPAAPEPAPATPEPAPPVPTGERRTERLQAALTNAIVTIGDLRMQLHETRAARRVADVARAADGVRLSALAAEREAMAREVAAARERAQSAQRLEAELRERAEAHAAVQSELAAQATALRAAQVRADELQARLAAAADDHAAALRRQEEELRRAADERIHAEVREARESAQEAAREARESAEAVARRARESAQEAAREAREAAETVARQARESAQEAAREARVAAEAAADEARELRARLARAEALLDDAETARELAEATAAAATAERQAAEVAWATLADEIAEATAERRPAPPEHPPLPRVPEGLGDLARSLAPAAPGDAGAADVIAGLDAAARALRETAERPEREGLVAEPAPAADPGPVASEAAPEAPPAGADAAPAVLEADPAPAVSEPDPAPAVSEPDPAAAVSEPDLAAAVSEPDPAAAVSEPGPAPAVSEPDPAPAVSEADPAPAVSEADPVAAVSEPGPDPAPADPERTPVEPRRPARVTFDPPIAAVVPALPEAPAPFADEGEPGQRPAPQIVPAPAPPPSDIARGRTQREYPPLRGALVKLAHDDPRAAAEVLAGLLPSHWRLVAEPLDYDLTIDELGTFSITVGSTDARVDRLDRPRRRPDLHVRGGAVALTELLAGVGARPRRFGGAVRYRGSRRRLALLDALVREPASLPALVAAGARLDPSRALRVLGYAIHPAWTRGHAFTVQVEIDGRPQHLVVRDGRGVDVAEGPAASPAARVTLTAAGLAALVTGDEPGPGDAPQIEGDEGAFARLLEWARRTGAAA